MSVSWKSLRKLHMSPCKVSQNSLRILKWNSSNPRLLELPQFHIAILISSSSNLPTNIELSQLEIVLKCTSSSLGLPHCSPLNLCLKKFHASSLTSKGFFFHTLSTFTLFIIFFHLPQLPIMWKNFEFESPCLSHLDLDFCFKRYSLCKTFLQNSSCNPS